MLAPLYDREAEKKRTRLTINADLVAKAKAAGIKISEVAERALARALAAHPPEQVRAEILQDLQAMNAYIAKHGSPATLARAHYARRRRSK